MTEVFEKGINYLEQGVSFAYAAVISKNGSSPAGVGARMLVLEDRTVGTIGGGGVEADVIRYARARVLTDRLAEVRSYNLASDGEAVSEYICGGCCEVLVCYIDAREEANLEIFREAGRAENGPRRAWLVYVLDPGEVGARKCRIVLSVEKYGVFGNLVGGGEFDRSLLENPHRIAVHCGAGDGRRYIVDSIRSCGRIYLLGAGHVACETAKLAVSLDFRVTVIDDRSEFANEERFPGCSCVVLDSFDNLDQLETDGSAYILIMTRGHLSDRTALRWALGKGCFYLGMIGSAAKRDMIYDSLRAEGIDSARLSDVHCPIGLRIGAKTPAEIAVSIMAEIIQCKNAAQKEEKH